MPTLVITKTYVDGSLLTEGILDAAFNSVTSFFNTTKLDSTNFQDSGISGDRIDSFGLTSTQIAAGAVTSSAIASSAITSAALALNINFPGNAVQSDGMNVVVSNTNATKSLQVIRGQVASTSGTRQYGEGFTVVKNSKGSFTVTFSDLFSDPPTVEAFLFQDLGSGPFFSRINSLGVNSSGFQIAIVDNFLSAAADKDFNFFAIGQRV